MAGAVDSHGHDMAAGNERIGRPAEADSSRVPLGDRTGAWTVMQRARQALSGDATIARVAALEFTAQCQGPRRAFRTTVRSNRDGRVFFGQDFPDSTHYRAGMSL